MVMALSILNGSSSIEFKAQVFNNLSLMSLIRVRLCEVGGDSIISNLVIYGFVILLLITTLPILVFLNHLGESIWSEAFFVRVENDTDLVAIASIGSAASLFKVLVSNPSTGSH